MLRLFCVILGIGLVAVFACKTEVTYQKEQLTGHWAVFGAERDGKSTTLLNGAIFHFEENGIMNTNITGQESSGPFDLKENQVSFHGSEEMVFEIGKFVGDTLSLHTELQGMNFILDLHRTNTESQ